MLLHTSSAGSGPQHIALVHGLAGDGETWHDLAEIALATRKYTVTTVDLRGHGRSARAASYTVREFADDLVESLPKGVDDVISHSLGGVVVAHAIERLAPRRALYLDPGFRVALPTGGLGGWLVRNARFTLPLFIAARGRGVRAAAVTPENEVRVAAARQRWDRRMALRVFQDVATHPRPVGASRVPSTVLLSEDARFVVPDPLPAELASEGWDIRRISGLGHSLFLEDAQAVWERISDVV
ncbi:alpha/beta fold hydrolase [Microbacterium sp. RD1]|uniref:alpha/beta fold hydrolase n=1 Tax=Microbacterium sp. RD1 TaxID=3457313 RepID=UPI003FA56128